jgi:ribose transport system substrate-binding protein
MKICMNKRVIAVVVTFAALATFSSCASSSDGDSDTAPSEKVEVASDLPTLEDLYSAYESTPPEDGPAVATGKKVALISCGEAYPSCAVMGKEMKKATDVLGWDLQVFDGAGNVGGGFATAIRQATAWSPDAMIVYGIDCAAAKQPLKEARDANITLLGLEDLDCSDSGDGDALFTAPFVYNSEATNGKEYWESYGTAAAAYIANARPDAKIIAAGVWDEPTGQIIYDALFAGLKAWCPDCEIVARVSGQTAEAYPGGPIAQRFQSALVKHPDVNVIYTPYDNFFGTTLNGLKAIRDAGLRDQALLFGGLGTEEGLDYLRNGDIDAVPHAVDKGWLAWAAIDQVNRLFDGDDRVAEGVGPRLLDDTQDLGTSGPYVTQVGYVSGYKALWGK